MRQSLLIVTAAASLAAVACSFPASERAQARYPAGWPAPWWSGGDHAAAAAPAVAPAIVGGQPEILVIDGRRFPYATASDGEHVYWTTVHAGTVQRIRVTGDAPELLAEGLREPRELVVDDEHVYVATEGGVARVSTGGGTPRMWLRDVRPGGIAVDDDHIYVADQRARRIVRVSKRDRSQEVLATTRGAPEKLVLAGGQVIWAEDHGGRIWRVATGGGPASLLARLPSTPFALAADRRHVYAAPFGHGNLVRIDLTSGAVHTVATGLGDVHSIALDDRRVYWTDLDGNAVWCAEKGRPAPAVLVERQKRADGISLARGSIFWITSQVAVGGRGGAIMHARLE